jgi:hypothetical protein
MSYDPQQVQSVGVAGLARQDLTVQAFSFGQMPGLMQAHGAGHVLLRNRDADVARSIQFRFGPTLFAVKCLCLLNFATLP